MKVGHTNDVGWGCCIRVAQMLTAHTILRHMMGDDYSRETLFQEQKIYLRVLTMMQDNVDGLHGCFSIQNVARMSLIYNKYPGEWHGPGSISNVFKDLNKLYQPVEDLKFIHFPDGMIYYDKVEKVAKEVPKKYLIELMKKVDMPDEKLWKMQKLHILFKKYTLENGQFHVEQEPLRRQMSFEGEAATGNADSSGDDEDFFERGNQRDHDNNVANLREWRNGVLLLVSNRLGLRKVQEEFLEPLKHFFDFPLNCGIIGGHPGQAFYLVGH